MVRTTKQFAAGWGPVSNQLDCDTPDTPIAQWLMRIVDAGLIGIICIAPFFFGGRHDFGRLVFVALIAATAAAWFARQALLAASGWNRTVMHGIIGCAAGWLLLQIMPLPPEWIARLSPRTAELLPMWTDASGSPSAAAAGTLGQWETLSITPHETAKSLAMLAAYGLLFVVVAQRVGTIADVRRFVGWIGFASALMAGFGLLQYVTSDGQFFWFYDHPFRTTDQTISGSFINRNHFASFLVLGVGPLAAWLMIALRYNDSAPARKNAAMTRRERLTMLAIMAALALVVFAILSSLSRGGAIVLLVAASIFFAIGLYHRLLDVRLGYGLCLFGFVVVGLLSCYGYDQVSQRLDDFADVSVESMDQDQGRRKIWSANVAAFRAAWLTGAGAGSHREICPIYLPETHTHEYTHAENGYLQIATEAGAVGLALLAAAIGVCGSWCLTCLRYSRSPNEILSFGACGAGLVASAVHSAFDFVWYIPACMSVTVILAACVLRLSQFATANTRSNDARTIAVRTLPRARWLEMAAAVVVVGGWTVYTFFGPAIAAIHWDRYLCASVIDSGIARQQLIDFMSGKATTESAMRRELSKVMLDELRRVVAWDSQHARAHARLADRLMAEFELRTAAAANAMDITQIREAAMGSTFSSQQALGSWLERAFGAHSRLLFDAIDHAHRALAICPLQGDAYLYLADLCFLEGASRSAAKAYVDQGLKVRPYDKNVLFRAGRQELFLGEPSAALDHWSRCYRTPGAHQQQIVYRLVASGMPASEFVKRFEPKWPSLRDVWINYRDRGSDEDVEALLRYATEVSARQARDPETARPESIWFGQAMMYADVGRQAETVACLERAHAANPRQFYIRSALQNALLATGRYAEAEPHVRWCLARRPADKGLNRSLKAIAKHRLEQREAALSNSIVEKRTWPR